MESAREVLEASNLTLPHVPARLALSMRVFHLWSWGTRKIANAYAVSPFLDEFGPGRPDVPEYVLIEHAGHGINSYAIHYYVVVGRLAMFVQVGWGGVYMTEPETGDSVRQVFRAAPLLAQAAEEQPTDDRPRVLVFATNFGRGFVVDAPIAIDRLYEQRTLTLPEAMAGAAERLNRSTWNWSLGRNSGMRSQVSADRSPRVAAFGRGAFAARSVARAARSARTAPRDPRPDELRPLPLRGGQRPCKGPAA